MKLRTELTEAQAKMFVNNPVDWGNYYYSDKQNDKRNFGNGYWPNSQGYEFRGRGCAQITGKNNYLSYYEYRKSDGYRGSFEVLVNAVSNPNSDECYLSAIWFYVKIIKRPIEPALATAKWVGNTNTAKERTMLYNQYLSVL
jgi:predicted chitinase